MDNYQKVSWALQWKWPEAVFAVRAGVLKAWSHPTQPWPAQGELAQAVAEWEAAGSPVPRNVPEAVTKLQLVRALRATDLKNGFDSALAAAAQADPTVTEDWTLAVEVMRADPMVTQISAAMGLGLEDVDALFLAAASL